MISKEIRDKLIAQGMNEIENARQTKQGKVSGWQKTETMYYSKKEKLVTSRANIGLSRMQEFVHILLSKIDNPLIFKFVKRKNAQTKRVERLNALRKRDSGDDDWDIKDLVGKKQAIMYGRAIYSYHASSPDKEYQANLENIDVYNFLIDPNAGGIDIEEASYLGDYSVTLNRKEIEQGAKDGLYIKDEAEVLLSGAGNEDDSTQEETNKKDRERMQGTINTSDNVTKDVWKFWRWYTTFEGERYYLLMSNDGACIKTDKLTDLFPATKKYPKGAYPIWTYATFLDLTEFWTPSYCDYAREIFMAEDVTINQMFDNAEAINKPQRLVNDKVQNQSQLVYRRDGVISVKGDVNKAYMTIETPSITTPIKVYEILESIQQKSSGVTDLTAGVSDEKGKVGIYEGNKEAENDRFGLLNKSYAFGYKRFAKLYELGVKEHLVKKTAIDLLGVNGVEVNNVSKEDIFKLDDEFGLMVESSNAQLLASTKDKNTKMLFLGNQVNNQTINQKKLFEIQADIVGLGEDDIEQLLDTSAFGDIELMAEADRDIESLLEGEDTKLNKNANNAYKQKLVNYIKEHEEDIDLETFTRITQYIEGISEIINRNEARQLQEDIIKMQKQQMLQQQANPTSGSQTSQKPVVFDENEL